MATRTHRTNRPALIDAHVHLDDARFDIDRTRVLDEARAAGIVAQVVPAVSRRLWPRLRAVCGANDDLFACYGLHPCFHDEHGDDDIAALAHWLGRERPVAVGECGLDYLVPGADKASQQHLFAAQLALAREFRLPIVIHARRAVEDVIRMIRASGHNRGLVHSFSGSLQQARRLIDLGYHLGFGGAVTYTRATRLQDILKHLPLDALVLETDAPDQPGKVHRGQRNEPAWLIDNWRAISALRAESAHAVAAATTRNAIALFGLPTDIASREVSPRQPA